MFKEIGEDANQRHHVLRTLLVLDELAERLVAAAAQAMLPAPVDALRLGDLAQALKPKRKEEPVRSGVSRAKQVPTIESYMAKGATRGKAEQVVAILGRKTATTGAGAE